MTAKKSTKKKTYKYRHRETYRGFDVDVKADTTADLVEKVANGRQPLTGGRSPAAGSCRHSAITTLRRINGGRSPLHGMQIWK